MRLRSRSRLLLSFLSIAALFVLSVYLDLGLIDTQTGSYTPLPRSGNSSNKSSGLSISAGRVVHVADADTLTVVTGEEERYKIRLQGIDAPERKQAYGTECKAKLREWVDNQQVRIEPYKKDRYGRVIAKLLLDEQDLALELLRMGCGWHYKAYAGEQSWLDRWNYAGAEKQARRKSLGLWQAKQPQAPWDYRKRR